MSETEPINPPVYQIKTLRDIFNLPTSETMRACIKEIGTAMVIARAGNDILKSMAGGEGSIEWPETFEWIDDGMSKGNIAFADADGKKLLSINVDM